MGGSVTPFVFVSLVSWEGGTAGMFTGANVRLDAGASVCLQGRLVQSKGAGQARELLVESTKVLGRCDPEVSQGFHAHSHPYYFHLRWASRWWMATCIS